MQAFFYKIMKVRKDLSKIDRDTKKYLYDLMRKLSVYFKSFLKD